jgi:valyl-tRNA synthetase
MSSELAPRYDHAEVEAHWYERWDAAGVFHADDTSDRPPYCIVIPPPNVTGSLHIGHALTLSIEDIMIRRHRMLGDNTLWMPGTDHAGIATQMVVERQLKRDENKTRHDLGREEFLKKVWEWKAQYGDRISLQARSLGASLDWERERFTLDDGYHKAVREAFVSLYEEDLIYRAYRLINWCPRCHTALSDLEVEHDEGHAGNLWHIAYQVKDSDRELVAATTRPETMLGDTAVAVHPEDERYADLIGKTVILPLLGREIPIIADDVLVDKDFGSGVVKVTPGHDPNDFQTGLRHDLEMISIFDIDARTTEVTGPYTGLDRFDARKSVLEALEAEGRLRATEDHSHALGKCQRCETVLEPMLSDQWFVKTKPLAEPAIEAVESGRVKIVPESHAKTYFHWMYNIQDWCISRQLWWGHQIPAWYCGDCDEIIVARETPDVCTKCGGSNLKQDQDVLDTWFSSGLWPFATLGWPEKTPALDTFYPGNVMETGHDILFFWVARMMMMGIKFMGEPPFETIYLHGMVLDKGGAKMSKVKGNVVDPLDVTRDVGADSLRFYLGIMSGQGRAIKFDMNRVIGYRNFINKVWNATRFAMSYIGDLEPTVFDPSDLKLSMADRWMLSRLNHTVDEVNRALDDFQFNEAAEGLYHFFWHEFCDWYIELVKATLNGDDADAREAACRVLTHSLDVSLRLLHPFMPFVTEEIWQKLPVPRPSARPSTPTTDTIALAAYPSVDSGLFDDATEAQMTALQDIITAIRTIRSEMNLPPRQLIDVKVRAEGDILGTIESALDYVNDLCRIGEFAAGSDVERPPASATAVVRGATIYIPLEGLIDLDEERARLTKESANLEKYIGSTTKKLQNAKFIERAPEEVIATERGKLADAEVSLARLQATLESIT